MPPSVTSRKSRGENLQLTSRHYQTRACNPSQKPVQGFKHSSPTRGTTDTRRGLGAGNLGGGDSLNASPFTTARHQAGRARISRNSGRSGARTGYLRRADADAGRNAPRRSGTGGLGAMPLRRMGARSRGPGDDGPATGR
jgi:hypothetical protein